MNNKAQKAVATILSVFACSLMFSQLSAQSARLSNVSFEDVMALPAYSPTATLAYGDNEFQFGKLWLPNRAQQRAPLVILIHGGCWLNSFSLDHTDAMSSALTDEGYAVWALEYRRTGDEGGAWPGTFNDVLAGIDFVTELGSYNIESSAPAIIGHSAGGHLALLAGAENPQASVVLGLAAIADLEKYAEGNNSCQQAAPAFMGAPLAGNSELYASANPARQELHSNSVLLQGDIDAIVPADQVDDVDAPHIIVRGAGHFDWIHSQTEAYVVLLQQLDQALKQ